MAREVRSAWRTTAKAEAEAKAEADTKSEAQAEVDATPEQAKAKQEEVAAEQPTTTTAPEVEKSDKVLPKPRDQENFTDPDSRIMPTSGKAFEQCYNGQIAVDAESRIVVATAVVQSTNDNGQLVSMVNEVFETTGEVPAKVVADAGYKNEDEMATMSKMGIDTYVALGREGKTAVKVTANTPYTAAMGEKLKTPEGRAIYKQRKGIVEPVFGWLKRVLGFRSFSLRGLSKVRGEWDLVCMALNLRRMASREVAK